jgi:PAS domain S-box-containing protein
MSKVTSSNPNLNRENERLRETVEAREAELSVLNSIQKALYAGEGIDSIFEIAGEQISQVFPGEGVALYTYDPETNIGEAKYILEDGVRHFPPPFRAGPIGQKAAKTKQTLVINSRKEFEDLGAITVEGTKPSLSGMYAPLIVNDKPVGALNIESTKQEHAFENADVQLVNTIARSLSIALENARLFNEAQRLLEETEARNAELALINIVQSALASKLDMQAIFNVIGDKLQEVFSDAQVVDILDYDPATQLFHPRYVIERGKRYEVEPWTARGFRKHVIETGEPLVINSDMDAMAKKFDNDWVVLGEFAKSWVGVPMIIAGEPRGVISLQHIDKENAFSDSDVRLIQTLADSMSVALENARLFDETEHLLKETEARNAELAIINTVQQALSSELDIRGIFDAVGDKLRQIFDSQTIAIYSADLREKINKLEYGYEKGRKLEPVSQPFSSLHEHLINLQDTCVFNGNFPEFASQFEDYQVAAGEMPKSLIRVPVKRFIGSDRPVALTLQDIDGEKEFTDSDIRLLETLANSMGVALENARLFNETQRLLKETEQRAAELQIINSVQEGLASKFDMQAIYDLIGEKIQEIFDADTTFIAFLDEQEDLIVKPYYNDRGARTQHYSRPFGEGLAERVIESGSALMLGTAEETRALGAYEIASPGSTKDLNESFLGVPIFKGGRAIGVTSVQSYTRNAYTDNDLTLLQTLTNSMSVALENARLFAETERLLEETEQRAAELETINTVGQALVAESDLGALIDLIGEQVRQIFHADIVYVAMLDPETKIIHFPYTHGEEFIPLELGNGLTSKVIESGEPLLINTDMEKRRQEMGVTRIGKRAASYLGVPIKMAGSTIGVISVQSVDDEEAFCENDMRLLNTIAANVSAAIHNAKLFEEITRQKQYYQAVIENSPAAIVLLDLEANVTGWNPAAKRLFGYTEDEALGQNIDDLVAIRDEMHAEAVRYSQQALREKQVNLLARRTRKDGSLVEVDISGLPVRVAGEDVGLIAIYHDVTELQRARLAAEEANRAKSTFLANMSHELRTPLNAIIGFTRIVRRKSAEALPEKQLDNLDKVLVSAEHLLSLINTVLDISKIEAGRLDVKVDEFELDPLVQEVVDTSQPLIKEGVQLRAEVVAEITKLRTDQDKLRQIFINLLSNAAKFTHEGEIVLSAWQEGECLFVDVCDTGIGIPAGAIDKVFEEFQQADTSTTRQYGGTGLGLSISRSLARLLGGDLTVASVEGKGSTFTLSIPLIYSDAQTQGNVEPVGEREVAIDTERPLILSIDDDPNVHDMLEENLGEHGYQVVGVCSGEEGLRLAKTLMPMAITLDIMMPQKDGWQVLHELKSDPETRHIPVVLVSIVDKQSLGYQLGAADYLVKPLEEDALLSALGRIRAERNGKNVRVLVVDDDDNIPALVSQILNTEQYTVMSASDGQQALEMIQVEKPDVLLLDLMMPRMDGITLIEELEKAGLEIPVIVLTAKDLTGDEVGFLEGSVEKIIIKNGLDSKKIMIELERTMAKYLPSEDLAAVTKEPRS